MGQRNNNIAGIVCKVFSLDSIATALSLPGLKKVSP